MGGAASELVLDVGRIDGDRAGNGGCERERDRFRADERLERGGDVVGRAVAVSLRRHRRCADRERGSPSGRPRRRCERRARRAARAPGARSRSRSRRRTSAALAVRPSPAARREPDRLSLRRAEHEPHRPGGEHDRVEEDRRPLHARRACGSAAVPAASLLPDGEPCQSSWSSIATSVPATSATSGSATPSRGDRLVDGDADRRRSVGAEVAPDAAVHRLAPTERRGRGRRRSALLRRDRRLRDGCSRRQDRPRRRPRRRSRSRSGARASSAGAAIASG